MVLLLNEINENALGRGLSKRDSSHSIGSRSSSGSSLADLFSESERARWRNHQDDDDDNDSCDSDGDDHHDPIHIRSNIDTRENEDDGEEDPYQIIAALRQDLQQLRETTDEEYVVSVAINAQQKEKARRAMMEINKERNDAIAARDESLAVQKIQQRHMDALTEELLQLQTSKDQAEEQSRQHLDNLQQAHSQLDVLRDGMDQFRKAFEDWLCTQVPLPQHQQHLNHNTLDHQQIVDVQEPPERIEDNGRRCPIVPSQSSESLTGVSPTCPMGELKQAYQEFSDIVDETGTPRRKRSEYPKRSWPEPPKPIKMIPSFSGLLLGGGNGDGSPSSLPSSLEHGSRSTGSRRHRRCSDSVHQRPIDATTSKHSRSKSYCSTTEQRQLISINDIPRTQRASLQAGFIDDAVKKKRKSNWSSNLSKLLGDPTLGPNPYPDIGVNLMHLSVEFRCKDDIPTLIDPVP